MPFIFDCNKKYRKHLYRLSSDREKPNYQGFGQKGFYRNPFPGFLDVGTGEYIPIFSLPGQARRILECIEGQFMRCPEEWLLLCRLASTIQYDSNEENILELLNLSSYFRRKRYEEQYGHAEPYFAWQIEQKIVLCQAKQLEMTDGCDAGLPIAFWRKYELDNPGVFRQADRNLLLRYACYIGNNDLLDALAHGLSTKAINPEVIPEVCKQIERVYLERCGLSQTDGMEIDAAESPSDEFDYGDYNSELQPAYVFWPKKGLTEDSVLLTDGSILLPDAKLAGWWKGKNTR